MNLSIRRMNDKYIVFDKSTNQDKSIKYDDEVHALRFIKTFTKFPGDYRLLQVEKTYEQSAVAVAEPEPEVATVPWEPYYQCSECGKTHLKTSNIGRDHLKYRVRGDK